MMIGSQEYFYAFLPLSLLAKYARMLDIHVIDKLEDFHIL